MQDRVPSSGNESIDDRLGNSGSQTVRRTLGLLQLIVAAQRPVSLTELSSMSGLTTSTAHRLLATLETTGFITREHRGRSYVVGDELVRMSARVMHGFSLVRIARPVMERLVDLTSETVTLHIPNGDLRTCVATVEGKHTIRRIIEVGETMPLGVGPSGKVILAHYEPDEREAILARTREEIDVDKVARQMEAIVRDGYLSAVGDRTPGVASLSMPVFGPHGIAASMTVSGPSNRWTREAMKAVAPEAVTMVAELSRRLGATGSAAAPSAPARRRRA